MRFVVFMMFLYTKENTVRGTVFSKRGQLSQALSAILYTHLLGFIIQDFLYTIILQKNIQ